MFMTEHTLPGMTSHNLAVVQRGLLEAGRRLTVAGRPVRYLRGTYVPAQGRWICLFEAADKEAVRKAIEIAQVPRADVEEVLDLQP